MYFVFGIIVKPVLRDQLRVNQKVVSGDRWYFNTGSNHMECPTAESKIDGLTIQIFT